MSILCRSFSVFVAIMFALPAAHGQSIKAKLVIHELHCAGTTGELDLPVGGSPDDEIYILIKGKKSDGSRINARVPTESVWSLINKDGPKRKRLNETLWSESLESGESVELFVLFMEEDVKRFDDYTKKFDELLDRPQYRAAANNFGGGGDRENDSIVNELLRRLITLGFDAIKNDTDDVPGVLRVRIWNDMGTIHSSWQPFDRSEEGDDKQRKLAQPASHTFNLKGDGCLYHCAMEAVKQ